MTADNPYVEVGLSLVESSVDLGIVFFYEAKNYFLEC